MSSGSSSTNPASTAPINPYQVPSEVAPELSPVYCRGTCSLDDLLIAIHDTPPAKVLKTIFDFAIGIALLGFFGVLAVLSGRIEIVSIFWGVVGFALLSNWGRLKSYIVPKERARRQRIKRLAKHQLDRRTVFHQEGMAIWTNSTWMSLDWSYFTKCRVFPKHLQIPFAIDPFQRIVLPLRFFASPMDAFRVIEFLRFRLGLVHDEKLSLQDLGAVTQGQESARSEIVGVPTWSADEWPFASNPEEERRFDIKETGIPRTATSWAKILPRMVIQVLEYSVPFWIPPIGWAMHCWIVTGDFSFFTEHAVFSTIAMIPIAGSIAIVLFAIWNAFQVTQSAGKSFEMRLRREGLFVVEKYIKGWYLWSEMESFEVTPHSAGWVTTGAADAVMLQADQFSRREEFDSFCEYLTSLDSQRKTSIPLTP